MTDVTVVGASGFIGRYLYRFLRTRPSLQVKGTYCRSRTNDELLPVDITVYMYTKEYTSQGSEPFTVFLHSIQ